MRDHYTALFEKKKINREIKIIKSSTLLYIIKYTFFLHLFVSNRSRRINQFKVEDQKKKEGKAYRAKEGSYNLLVD